MEKKVKKTEDAKLGKTVKQTDTRTVKQRDKWAYLHSKDRNTHTQIQTKSLTATLTKDRVNPRSKSNVVCNHTYRGHFLTTFHSLKRLELFENNADRFLATSLTATARACTWCHAKKRKSKWQWPFWLSKKPSLSGCKSNLYQRKEPCGFVCALN